jgi:hypothetical protein
MVHMLTISDLEDRPQGAYYVGPLEEAKLFIREYANVSVFFRPGKNVTVFIDQDGGDQVPDWNHCNEFGNGTTEEEAWRWALGAAFGPADDEFSAFPLTHNHALAVRSLVNHHFPKDQRVDVFYSTTGPNATVMDTDGHMWQVFPDGTLKVYKA